MTETRKLAAIMAVDVVGYSRLMGEDEAGTASAVREHRDAARPIVEARGGRIVKTMGDGLLLEFPSVVDAVECGVAIQRTMIERNAGAPDTKRIVYRIGVNLGDVLIEGDDIVGDGVNIAARLEGLCEPGGILISGSAFDQVRGKVAFGFADLGEKTLKNISRPIRSYAVATEMRSAALGSASAAIPNAGTPRFSLVVLPFANIGGGEDQDYFVDGVTESLTTDLSRISGAFVIGRNTAFTYRGKAVDLRQVGRELNVRYVLEGSVQRAGTRLRVNVQLIEAESGAHLWAERFDKPVADLFDMQDEIVARLASQLNAELVAVEARRAERTPHPDALDLCFQGLAKRQQGYTQQLLFESRDLYARALALEPGNVDALIGFGMAETLVSVNYMVDDGASRLATAEAAIRKALSVAPNLGLANYWLGIVLLFSKRAHQGLAMLSRALSLDPNMAAAHAFSGVGKIFIGEPQSTEACVLGAMRLSPRDFNACSWLGWLGTANLLMRKDEEDLEWFRKSIEVRQNYPISRFLLAATLALLDRRDEAHPELEVGRALSPTFTVLRYRKGAQSDDPKFLAARERIIEGLRNAGLPEQ